MSLPNGYINYDRFSENFPAPTSQVDGKNRQQAIRDDLQMLEQQIREAGPDADPDWLRRVRGARVVRQKQLALINRWLRELGPSTRATDKEARKAVDILCDVYDRWLAGEHDKIPALLDEASDIIAGRKEQIQRLYAPLPGASTPPKPKTDLYAAPARRA
jgi:hypothetical protein